MRHIPEDELHAYLDQGLSRTQCVEIESHLADCYACQAQRDQIAALRDRTTALLARLAPPRRVPPAFESIRRRAADEASQRRRRLRAGAWAASLVAAVGFGWMASSFSVPGTAVKVAPASSPAAPPSAPAIVAASEVTAESVKPAPAAAKPAKPKPAAPNPAVAVARAAANQKALKDSIRAAMLALLDPAPAVELSRLDSSPARTGREFDGMWRTVSWDGARAEAGERLPHIDGLPVLKVQVQSGDQGKRSVMVVAQQLSSGEVIQTIEGPASDVSQMLARRSMADLDSVITADGASQISGGDHAMAISLGGDRMLAITGALPSDSLRAMIRRLNAELRSK
ncbi:MAG: anti-sigma factor [Gemmatimonadales bacterium]